MKFTKLVNSFIEVRMCSKIQFIKDVEIKSTNLKK